MNQTFEFRETAIQGLLEIQPFYARDRRGSFTKDYAKETFEANGVCHNLSEVFYTTSYKGVIRALHFQREKQQPKLVRCICGHVYDVAVDLRRDSPTFRKWQAFELSGDTSREILIPAGCAHGYLVLEDAVVSYKCSEKFYAEYDDGILWNDPDLAVDWPVGKVGGTKKIILSDKDSSLQTFQQFMQTYGGF